MERKTEFEQRMYFLVLYSLSPIQKGIQAGHAALEYARLYNTDEYQDFVNHDKTWIVLDGGTSNSDPKRMGTLDSFLYDINYRGIRHAKFHEPDLNDALTAVCFLADERVWNKEAYPDLKRSRPDKPLDEMSERERYHWDDLLAEEESNWFESIGGRNNAFLRETITKYRLAR